MSPWVARITAMSKSSYGCGSISAGSCATPSRARSSVPPSISRSMRILKSFSVGSWRIDSAPVSCCKTSSVPCSPSAESGSVASVNQMLNSWLRR